MKVYIKLILKIKKFLNWKLSSKDKYLFNFLDKGDIAIDCGAHVGLWARDLSNFFDKIYCFEPSREYFECLKVNIKNPYSAILQNNHAIFSGCPRR